MQPIPCELASILISSDGIWPVVESQALLLKKQ